MINTDLYATLITIIFIVESFWEFRLYAWLRGNQDLACDPQLKQRLASTMRVESKWNWGSWLLIILLLIAPDNWSSNEWTSLKAQCKTNNKNVTQRCVTFFYWSFSFRYVANK